MFAGVVALHKTPQLLPGVDNGVSQLSHSQSPLTMYSHIIVASHKQSPLVSSTNIPASVYPDSNFFNFRFPC